MPYIAPRRRYSFNLSKRGGGDADVAGELNYLLTKICMEYIEGQGGLSYQTINDILGALEGAKLEFYRRVAASYEDKKIEENGDVY